MIKKSLSLAIILLLLTGSAQASIFTDIFNFISSPSHQQASPTLSSDNIPMQPFQPTGFSVPISHVQSDNKDEIKPFSETLMSLNTNTNIQELNSVMDEYGVQAVKVRVSDYNENFYVVKGQGIVQDYPTNDREIVLTSKQITRISEYLYDGQLDFFDRWQIYAIIKMG